MKTSQRPESINPALLPTCCQDINKPSRLFLFYTYDTLCWICAGPKRPRWLKSRGWIILSPWRQMSGLWGRPACQSSDQCLWVREADGAALLIKALTNTPGWQWTTPLLLHHRKSTTKLQNTTCLIHTCFTSYLSLLQVANTSQNLTDSSTAVKYYIMLFFLFETRAKYYKV